MLDIIKKAGVNAVGAANPVTIVYATVTSLNPLEVNVDQRFSLTEDFLVVPELLTNYSVTIGETEYMIREGLKLGDKVLLLRVQGGQQYVVLDKVVIV